jgi:hypothetical protein
MPHTFNANGVDHTIPSFNELPVGVIRKARKSKDDADQAFIIIETIMGEDSPELAAIDAMLPAEFQSFIEGWTQGSPVGESVKSSN